MVNKINKLAFIISSLAGGGAERVVSELANYMSVIGIDVSIILVSKDIIEYKLDEKIKIVKLCNEIDYGKKNYISRLIRLRKATKKINPDIVISFGSTVNMYLCIALMFTKIKLIISDRVDPSKEPKNIILKLIRLFVYYRSNGFVFQTEEAKQYYNKTIQKRATIIANPLMKELPERHNGERKKVIVAVGRLEDQKNYPLLIEAFKVFCEKHNDYRLMIYGKGSLETYLKDLVIKNKMENHIIFMGRVDNFHADILDSAMFIMTSDFEGMPNALMEAMAIGLPCISTDCPSGGPAFLIKHGENGLLFPIGNRDELLKCMEGIANDEMLSEKLSINASKIKEKFNISKIVDEWLTYCSDVVK